MALRRWRWDHWQELEDISRRLNHFLDRQETDSSDAHESVTMTDWTPSVEVRETDREFRLIAELPGVRKEDLQVTAQDGLLVIKGERRADAQEDCSKVHRTERQYGRFYRSFTLPDVVKHTPVTAELVDGLLHIHLPKSGSEKENTIEVQAAA